MKTIVQLHKRKKKLMTPWLTGFAVLNSSNNENTLLHFDLLVVNKMADFFRLHQACAIYCSLKTTAAPILNAKSRPLVAVGK